MKIRVITAALLLMLSEISAVKADTPLDILGVEKSVNDVARRAQETGDIVARAFAEQMLRVIDEWKKANTSLINTAFDRLDDQTRKVFKDINNVASRLEKGETVAFIDVQRTMANAGQIVSSLPGASKDAFFTFYWPAVLTPGGEKTVTVHIIGKDIANANPRISEPSNKIKIKKYSDNDIGFDINRSELGFAETEAKKAEFTLQYDVSKSSFYNPTTWGSNAIRDRNVEIRMLPNIPGTVNLSQEIEEEHWETRVIGPITVGGVGKDNTYHTGYNLTPQEQSEGWIVDYAAQAGAHFDDNFGDGDGGSSCTGYDAGSFSPNHVEFLIQHGHKRSGFHNSDAHQNCRVWVHEKRRSVTTKQISNETKPLSWSSDIDFPLADNIKSYAMVLKLYNGTTYTISSEQQFPYSLFDIIKDKNNIKFRPRPQREF